MNLKPMHRLATRTFIAFFVLIGLLWSGASAETLKYSSSAQVSEALGDDTLKHFSQKTGITVDLFVDSSFTAVSRLMNGVADIASTAGRLDRKHQDYGYIEIPFCKAPMVIITNVQTKVAGISSNQLQAIFSGELTNWKSLGGPDKRIVLIVPGLDTGAFKNFHQMALKNVDVKYDFTTYRSTGVIELVRRIPWSLSFISMGAPTSQAAIKTLKIDGLSFKDEQYPYIQVFSFVTKSQLQGAALKFVSYVFSPEAQEIIRKNEMIPLARPETLLK